MPNPLDWLRRRTKRTSEGAPYPRAALRAATSKPEDLSFLGSAMHTYIPLPDDIPFAMLQVYRTIRDAFPDISDAVWTWKRLCQTGYDIDIVDASSDVARRRAESLLHALDTRVNGGDRGMDGLLDVFYTSLFTFGAAALEVVLSPSRESIHDVIPVDVWTVRFRREQGRLQAYQLHEGREIRLPMERFIYVGLDRDGTNPYGRSMLRSIPFVIKIQQRLIEDMAKATRNMGYPRLHLRYTPGDRQRGESPEAYRKRVDDNLTNLQQTFVRMDPDQNIVTLDDVQIELLQGNTRSNVFYENHKAIEEQVITGMHLMPILMGRNYGTTETYGTAQYEIINRQVETVNRSVKRILERLYNFELALMWGEATAKVHTRSNRTTDVLKEATARSHEIANALQLRNEGFLDASQVAQVLNLDPRQT